jgi:hypothetical protein
VCHLADAPNGHTSHPINAPDSKLTKPLRRHPHTSSRLAFTEGFSISVFPTPHKSARKSLTSISSQYQIFGNLPQRKKKKPGRTIFYLIGILNSSYTQATGFVWRICYDPVRELKAESEETNSSGHARCIRRGSRKRLRRLGICIRRWQAGAFRATEGETAD